MIAIWGLLALSVPNNKESAATLVDEGNRLFEAGLFDAALARYEGAQRLYPSPKLLINIARSEEELGRRTSAAQHFVDFLRTSGLPPGSSLLRDAERRVAVLNQRLGRLEVKSPTPVSIAVDGRAVGATPVLGVYVEPGRRQVVATCPVCAPYERFVEVEAGQGLSIDLPNLATIPVVTQAPVVAPSGPEVERSAPLYTQWWLWALVVGAVAGGTIGLVSSLRQEPYVLEAELRPVPVSEWDRLPGP